MECPACGLGNRDQAAFCSDCGSGLARPDSTGDVPDARTESGGGTSADLIAGRYRLGSSIGEGGMKSVFVARDERLGREVALAFFKTGGLVEADLLRIDREAKAMVSLGEHESIMPVIDFGEHEGRRYMVTPLMEGGDLATRIADSGGLELGELLEIASALSDALAFAHTKGIIHRDVKPENVWFGTDSRPKLGDFGLAVALDASRITHEGTVLGTPAYLAPECATGGLAAGPPSDLYSLGVVVYEMATGMRPFEGSMAEVISKHVSVDPVSPKVHNPEIPAALETLILKLLEKSPERRPQSAREAHSSLLEMIAARDGASPAQPHEMTLHGRFVGRIAEMKKVREAVDAAAAGRVTVITISGEPGIGKTRLAEEACAYGELRGFLHATGRCIEDDGTPAFWPWQQALRILVEKCDPDVVRDALGAIGPAMARILPEVRTVIPGVEPAPAPTDPDQARFQLFDAIASFLRRLSGRRPVLVVLEDIHWADTPSLKLLQFVTSAVERERMLVIGTFRDIELGRHHPLAGAFAELAKNENAARISLTGMERDEVKALIGALGGGIPSPELVQAIEDRTEGNPFFVAEVVRLLAESGKSEDAVGWSIEIPQGVREALGYRLNKLGVDANKVLGIAAVIGREFPLNLLERAASGADVDVLEAIVGAEDAGLVVAADESPDVFMFAHALVRETLYRELSTARRAMLHRKVASAIELQYSGTLGAHVVELAQHLLKSGAGDAAGRAAGYLIDAGRQSLEKFAYEDAAKNFEDALEAIELAGEEGGPQECEALICLGDALWRQREGYLAKKHLRRALEIAQSLGDWNAFARALLLLPGQSAGVGFVVDDIDDLVVGALANLGDHEVTLRARLSALRIWTVVRSDDAPADVHEFSAVRQAIADETLELAEASGGTRTLLDAKSACAMCIAEPARWSDRKGWADDIVRLALEIEDWDGVIQGHFIRMAVRYEAGLMEEAETDIAAIETVVSERKPAARGWMVHVARALRAQLHGEFKVAEACAAENMRMQKAGDVHEALKAVTIAALTQVLLAEQGRISEIALLYASAAKGYTRSFLMRGPVAPLVYIYTHSNQADKAKDLMQGLAAQDFFLVPDHQWLSNMTYLAGASAKLGDAEASRRIYELLHPFADKFAVIGSGVACLGSTHRSAGQLATAFGDFELARSHFEKGIEANARVGARPYTAHCHRELAATALKTGLGGAVDALDHVEAAISLYDECDMEYWAAEAASLRALTEK